MEKKQNVECNVNRDGLCGLHGVEVERRKNSEKLVERIPYLLSAINKLIGFSTLMSLVVGAGFIYTRDVKNQLDAFQNSTRIETAAIERELKVLSNMYARTDEKYTSLLRELETLNKQITVLITQQRHEHPTDTSRPQ